VLIGTRHALALALQTVKPAALDAMQCVCIVVFFRIIVRRTWLVLVLSSLAILPIAMSGTFAGEQLALELAISLSGIALVFAVLLRFGFLALVVMFYTFLSMSYFPLTSDMSRPYAGASVMLLLGIAALAACAFYASRGGEHLFGRAILD